MGLIRTTKCWYTVKMDMPNDYQNDIFSRSLYEERATFRTDEDLATWVHNNLHLLPNIPQHLPEQRRVEIETGQWVFNRDDVACDETFLELRVLIQNEENADGTNALYQYVKRYSQSFAEWPHLTAMAIATHVTTNDSYDEPSYLPILDRTIEKYQPIHFPTLSLEYLHELRLGGLLCQTNYLRDNTLEIACLIFSIKNRKNTDNLPDDFHM